MFQLESFFTCHKLHIYIICQCIMYYYSMQLDESKFAKLSCNKLVSRAKSNSLKISYMPGKFSINCKYMLGVYLLFYFRPKIKFSLTKFFIMLYFTLFFLSNSPNFGQQLQLIFGPQFVVKWKIVHTNEHIIFIYS